MQTNKSNNASQTKKYGIRGSIQSKIDEFGEAYNEWNYEMYGRDSFQNANEKFKLLN